MALTAQKLISLSTSVGAEIFLPLCSHLSTLQQLDTYSTMLSDVDVCLLSSYLPKLVELKFALARNFTTDSLHYLKQLSALQVLEFNTSQHKHVMICASVLLVLPAPESIKLYSTTPCL